MVLFFRRKKCELVRLRAIIPRQLLVKYKQSQNYGYGTLSKLDDNKQLEAFFQKCLQFAICKISIKTEHYLL